MGWIKPKNHYANVLLSSLVIFASLLMDVSMRRFFELMPSHQRCHITKKANGFILLLYKDSTPLAKWSWRTLQIMYTKGAQFYSKIKKS